MIAMTKTLIVVYKDEMLVNQLKKWLKQMMMLKVEKL